jgi:hypothetical protein
MNQNSKKRSSPALLLMGAVVLVLSSGCAGQAPAEPLGPGTDAFPSRAAFGELRTSPTTGSEYIFDGAEWVPHDDTVEAYYEASDLLRNSAASRSKAVVSLAPDYCSTTYICSSSQGHKTHGAFMNDCSNCHRIDWAVSFELLWFDQPVNPTTGQPRPAYIQPTAANPNPPMPTIVDWNIGLGTCSNVACHGVKAGTFSYYFPDGSGEPAFNTVDYGATYATTPSFDTTGNSCVACHGNPPRNGAWHSGQHAGGPGAAMNQCQSCHPDATGTNGRGTAITNLSLHVNGVVNVQARFKSSCFGCH